MSSLKDFIALVKTDGLARNNKFAVSITLPKGMVGSAAAQYQSTLRNILLFCDTAALPGVNFATFANRTFGEIREVPYEKLFDNLSLSFYVDNSLSVKSMFDEWSSVVQNVDTRTFGFYDDYITTIAITVFDNKGVPRYVMELYEAYPKTIQAINLDYANKDVMKMSVNFVFKYWKKYDLAVPNTLANTFSFNLNDIINNAKDGIEEGLRIPDGYFTDFTLFQNSSGLSFENARSALYGELQGVTTSIGERTTTDGFKSKNKLGAFLG